MTRCRFIALELRGEETHVGVLDIATGVVNDLGAGFAPKCSPDSARLAFVRSTNGVSDIHVMDVDGTNLTQLTNDAAFDTFPVWSPDGATILFLSDAP